MDLVTVDIETIGTADLTKVGSANYAEHPDTKISMIAWKFGDGETFCIARPELTTKKIDKHTWENFIKFLNFEGKIIAHNATFEKNLFNSKLSEFVDSTKTSLSFKRQYKSSDFIDTSVLSNVFRGPAKLELSSNFFGLDVTKDTVGNKLMKAITTGKNVKPGRLKTSAAKFPGMWKEIGGVWYKAGFEIYERMEKYCKSDVEATWALFKKLNSKEKLKDLGVFLPHIQTGIKACRSMNDRGVLIDPEWSEILAKHKRRLQATADKYCMKTFGFLPAQRVALKNAIEKTGYTLEGMGKEALQKSFRDPNNCEDMKEKLKKYMELNKTSLNKIDALYRNKSEDNVLYDMFRFSGAYATGRFTSFGVQLQNLPRTEFETAEECKKILMKDDLSAESAVKAIRGCFIPRPGYKFFIADLSQIELRRVVDKAGYPEKVRHIHEGGDLYSELAAVIYKKKLKDVTKEERNVGKAFVLALGYGMGIVLIKENYEKITGEKLSTNEAWNFKNSYSEKYPNVLKLWKKYDVMVDQALKSGKELRIKLASGRYLNYGKIYNRKVKMDDGNYKFIKSYFNGKEYKAIYGSKIFQQIVQAECRDILLLKYNALYEQGARLILQVHDEVVVEVPENADLDKLKKAWYNAGREEIKKFFPTMIIDSDCVFSNRYWSH